MSEFTVSDTHSGVSVSVTVTVAPDAKYVEASALYLIPRIDDFASKVREAARTAASNGIWPIAADVVNAINECASQARTRDAANQKINELEAIGAAVSAERERIEKIHSTQLQHCKDVADSLRDEIDKLNERLTAKTKRSAARARGARK